ncbi:hypothetical protein ACFSFY_13990 [Sporosarcina siberiensis]|uniref:Uncharacterized protein n=1 Tax=Sporosarcina siberiensis TaxID=1365606 RepID=A0ABW4SI22_9BACL
MEKNNDSSGFLCLLALSVGLLALGVGLLALSVGLLALSVSSLASREFRTINK